MAAAASAPRIGRLERRALTGVLVREVVNYSSYWKSSTFSSTVEPTIYLLAFGLGFGSPSARSTGSPMSTSLAPGRWPPRCFSSAFPDVRDVRQYQFQRTYDAILAAPVDTEELVSAEAIWIATRRRLWMRPDDRGDVLRLDPAWGMLAVPFIAWIAGFGWANFGISVAGFSKSFENFNYVVSAVLPLFLLAGSFFPLDGFRSTPGKRSRNLPYHPSSSCATPCSTAGPGWVDVAHLAFLVGFGILMWRIAIVAMTRKLVD